MVGGMKTDSKGGDGIKRSVRFEPTTRSGGNKRHAFCPRVNATSGLGTITMMFNVTSSTVVIGVFKTSINVLSGPRARKRQSRETDVERRETTIFVCFLRCPDDINGGNAAVVVCSSCIRALAGM